MTTFELTGTIHAIMPTEQVKETFRKRDFVLRVSDGKYDQHIRIELINDNCTLVDNVRVNDPVRVLFNIRGREYDAKSGGKGYFTSLTAYRVESLITDASGDRDRTQMFDDSEDVPF